MNKRAITEVGILTIIFGIIVAIAIGITAPVISRVLGVGGELNTATTSLNSLQQKVLELIANPEPFAAARSYPLFIQRDKFFLAAFNAGDAQVGSSCADEIGSRPIACPADRACVCLYRETTIGKDFEDGKNPPVTCGTPFPDEVVFLAPADAFEEHVEGWNDKERKWNYGKLSGSQSVAAINDGTIGTTLKRYLDAAGQPYQYENLLLYGSCSWRSDFWDTQDTYIEKFKDGDKTLVFIARESTFTSKRYETLRRVVGVTFESVRQKMQNRDFGEAVTDAFELQARFAPDDLQRIQALMLLGEVWEGFSRVPEPPFLRQKDKITVEPYSQVLRRSTDLDWLRRAMLLYAGNAHWTIVEDFYEKKGLELPETKDAALKAVQLWIEAKKEITIYDYALLNKLLVKDERLDFTLLRHDYWSLYPAVRAAPGSWEDQIPQLRTKLTQFIAKYPQSSFKKEALYLLAGTYDRLDPRNVLVPEAVKMYADILRTYPQDYKVLGLIYDAKQVLWNYCFVEKRTDVQAECQTLLQQGLIAKPPHAADYDTTTLEGRKKYFAAVVTFAQSIEKDQPIAATEAYKEFLEIYGTPEFLEIDYTEKEDYEMVARALFIVAKAEVQLGLPEFVRRGKEKLAAAAHFARRSGNTELENTINAFLTQIAG